jgi:hypothetical protein
MWFQDKENIRQDQELFSLSDNILNEESFSTFIASLTDRFFLSSNRALVLKFLEFFETGPKTYKNKVLQDKLTVLLLALKDVKAFTAGHFLPFPKNQTGDEIRFSLHPDYFELEMSNGSVEEHRFFLDLDQKLRIYTIKLDKCYRDYRKAIRKKLKE